MGRGAHAAFGVVQAAPKERVLIRVLGSTLLGLYMHSRFFRWFSERSYQLVAQNRSLASSVTLSLFGDEFARPSYAFAKGLWVRWLGVVYLIAFASFTHQIPGLVGDEGILPASVFFEHWAQELPKLSDRILIFPTLAWFFQSTVALQVMGWLGAVAGVFLIWNRTRGLSLLAAVVAFFSYLSLQHAGQIFLQYQWDSLLLECGFFTVLLLAAPKPRVFCVGRCAPYESGWESRMRWVFLAIFAKLLFLSGWVKLASGDPSWRDGTALLVHFETQPLPSLLSSPLTQALRGLASLGAVGRMCVQSLTYTVIGIELLAPIFIFGPRRIRWLGIWILSSLQVAILLTGHYGFFNLLTLGLGFWLLDDRAWRGLWKASWQPVWIRRLMLGSVFRKPRVLSLLDSLRRKRAAFWIGLLSVVVVLLPAFHSERLAQVNFILAQWGISHPYGLFAVMTTERRELVFEVSSDGQKWRELLFSDKPVALNQGAPLRLAHLPRLDWQMWFAAMGSVDESPWVLEFAERILHGDAQVLALLGEGEAASQAEQDPRYIRGHLYRYRFSRDQTWERELLMPLWLPPRELPRVR